MNAPLEQRPNAVTKNSSWPIRMIVGMVIGVILGAAALVLTIEVQVVLLRQHASELGSGLRNFDPDLFSTMPRLEYDSITESLFIPAFLGALAGTVFHRASRFRKSLSILILLAFPVFVAGFRYYSLNTDYKPALSKLMENRR